LLVCVYSLSNRNGTCDTDKPNASDEVARYRERGLPLGWAGSTANWKRKSHLAPMLQQGQLQSGAEQGRGQSCVAPG